LQNRPLSHPFQVSDANWRFKAVNRTINDALDEMNKMEKSLSTEAK